MRALGIDCRRLPDPDRRVLSFLVEVVPLQAFCFCQLPLLQLLLLFLMFPLLLLLLLLLTWRRRHDQRRQALASSR